jgi:hypothetical protein
MIAEGLRSCDYGIVVLGPLATKVVKADRF